MPTPRYAYHVALLSVTEKSGFRPSVEVAGKLSEFLNQYAAEGWELFQVLPVTGGSVPMQQAYHYFRRELS